MNIKNNIISYLNDNEYVIAQYDNKLYIYNYVKIINYLANIIEIELINKNISIIGNNLTIIKMTKKEIVVKGIVKEILFINE